jgi:hypothetical protein
VLQKTNKTANNHTSDTLDQATQTQLISIIAVQYKNASLTGIRMDRYVRTSCGHNVSNIRPFLTDDKAQHVTSKVHFHISPACNGLTGSLLFGSLGSGSLGFSSGDHFGLNALLLMLQKSQLTRPQYTT